MRHGASDSSASSATSSSPFGTSSSASCSSSSTGCSELRLCHRLLISSSSASSSAVDAPTSGSSRPSISTEHSGFSWLNGAAPVVSGTVASRPSSTAAEVHAWTAFRRGAGTASIRCVSTICRCSVSSLLPSFSASALPRLSDRRIRLPAIPQSDPGGDFREEVEGDGGRRIVATGDAGVCPSLRAARDGSPEACAHLACLLLAESRLEYPALVRVIKFACEAVSSSDFASARARQ
mmetsp:Transcript_22215/g.39506  ORF Transcript_22215/g.39506 Transcript_22215/m.39506 type:complete len:236 (-) Transcript_22215:568-1275(-)